MMTGLRLYFLRHGKAESRASWAASDDLRPLTAQGEAEVRRVAAGLAELGVVTDVVVSSPLARARRTAELACEALGAGAPVLDDRLGHGFDVTALAGVVGDHRPCAALMLVGHEPSFSAVIGDLTGGRVVCKKAGVARVDVDDASLGGGRLVWLLPPGVLAKE
jgi:phosphohistidine phosphatase